MVGDSLAWPAEPFAMAGASAAGTVIADDGEIVGSVGAAGSVGDVGDVGDVGAVG